MQSTKPMKTKRTFGSDMSHESPLGAGRGAAPLRGLANSTLGPKRLRKNEIARTVVMMVLPVLMTVLLCCWCC